MPCRSAWCGVKAGGSNGVEARWPTIDPPVSLAAEGTTAFYMQRPVVGKGFSFDDAEGSSALHKGSVLTKKFSIQVFDAHAQPVVGAVVELLGCP